MNRPFYLISICLTDCRFCRAEEKNAEAFYMNLQKQGRFNYV